MILQNFPYRLQFYLQLTLAYCILIFLSLCKGMKSQKDFLVNDKIDSSNLLVVKIYSMIALRICVLVCASTRQFPNKSVFIKTISVTSSNLQSMFFIVLRRVCLSSLHMDSGECNKKSINIKTATANRI